MVPFGIEPIPLPPSRAEVISLSLSPLLSAVFPCSGQQALPSLDIPTAHSRECEERNREDREMEGERERERERETILIIIFIMFILEISEVSFGNMYIVTSCQYSKCN